MAARKFAQISAIVGALVWTATLLRRTGDSSETELIQKILLFAVFVVVPLALSIISTTEDWISLRLATFAQPVTAGLCFLSFITAPGIAAGVLVFPWFATLATIALTGLLRPILAQRRDCFELSISAGMLFLPVGGAWLIASRLGIQPIGFGDTIVLLTAVHFHFAGFAAPVLSGLTGRYVRHQRRSSRLACIASIAIVLGTPIVAAGITLSPTVAFAGALIVTLGLTLLAVLVIVVVVPTLNYRSAQTLLVVASASSLTAMVLACLYAYSIVTHTIIIDIPRMALTHGLLNSFGFALCGLLAWSLITRR